MIINEIKKVHCIGIGGIGVSAIARFFISRGAEVSGSDEGGGEELLILKKRGVKIFSSHDKKNISKDIDLVVYSPAVPQDNPEIVRAKELDIKTLSYPETLGELTENFMSIAVSGTNGKTSTTALLGKMLEEGKKDPTVIVGGRVPGWDNNLRIGESDIFVVEGCEYKRSMMSLQPHMIVLTNVEEDHLDYYKDLEDIIDAFSDYIQKLTEDDVLFYNTDDENTIRVSEFMVGRAVPFGLSKDAVIRAKDVVVSNGAQSFTLMVFGKELGTLTLHVPGIFNVYNVLAAASVAFDIGVSFDDIQKAVENFNGTWRRFEKVGEFECATIISDYAHHPTAVKGTIKAARDFYPDKKILAVFQPHSKDRTIKLFDEFVESFAEADEVIISEIYEVRGREETGSDISSKDLVREIFDRGGVDKITFSKDLETTEKLLKKKVKDFDVVLVMGAGDIDTVARKICSNK
jgi:UDP-N-acetylmuramate--alanine ligase